MKELCKYYPHSWMKLSTYESQVTYLENSESINTCKAVCQIWSRKTAQQRLHENTPLPAELITLKNRSGGF